MELKWKHAVVLFVAFSMVASGCLSKNEGANGGAASKVEGTDNGPLTMNWWIRGTPSEFPEKNISMMKQKVKEQFNVDLQVEIVDKNVYDEKLNVAWAGGTIPDMIEILDPKMAHEAISNDAALPLDNMIKNDPNFSKLPPEYFTKANGKIYSAPKYLPTPETIYYRVDWAKKLGLSNPQNAEELYAMLKAFAKNDPDGNGKDDTIGFTLESSFERTGPFWQMFVPVVPTNLALYMDKDNNIQSSWMLSDDMKSALSWLRKAYAEGVMDKEWVLEKSSTAEDKFVTGKTGSWVKGAQWIAPRYEMIRKKTPDADIMTLPVVKGKYGTNYAVTGNYTNSEYLTYACKQQERCEKVFAYIWGPEGVKTLRLGQEGVSYKVENNKYVWLDPAMEKVYNPGSLLTSVFQLKPPVALPVLEQSLKNTEGFRILTDLLPAMNKSEKAVSKVTDIDKMGKEYMTKIIIGEYGIEKYDEFVSKLKSMGMEDILKDVNTQFKSEQ